MMISENIRKYRKAAGMTQQDLANRLEVATITIQQYERGLRTPSLDMIKRLSNALNTHYYNLLGDHIDDAPAPTAAAPSAYDDPYYGFKAMLPPGFDLFGINEDGDAWLKYPDLKCIELSREDIEKLLEETTDYINYKLENFRKGKTLTPFSSL